MEKDTQQADDATQKAGGEVDDVLKGVMDDLAARERVVRMTIIARALVKIIEDHSGEMEAVEASNFVAQTLGIPVDEVRYGVVFAEYTGEIESTEDGAGFKVAAKVA